jgi:hypothetical protein
MFSPRNSRAGDVPDFAECMGAYGSIGEARRVDGILGFEPTDYEVSAEDDSVNLTAVFRKSQPGAKGTLRVEILADGEVVAEDETTAELGVARASWFSQGEPTVKHPGER